MHECATRPEFQAYISRKPLCSYDATSDHIGAERNLSGTIYFFTVATNPTELLSKCGQIADLTHFKASVLALNKQYVDLVNSGGQVTAFEKRQAKNNMYKLFQALERLEMTQTGSRFAFVGEPVPPESARKQPDTMLKVSPYEPPKIGGKTGETVPLGTDHAKQHVYLENLAANNVYGPRKAENLPWSVHVQNVKNSRLALRCDGPIILHEVESLVLVLECHQLRIHDMKNCHVYANVSNSRVVMERSENLTFSGISDAGIAPVSFAVDDFDWPTSETQNPHYEVRKDGVGEEDENEVKEILSQWEGIKE